MTSTGMAGAQMLAPALLGSLVPVAFSGSDSRLFLQSQLTNDVADLDGGGWQFSGLCNPKGRMLSSFVLFRAGEGEYIALMERRLSEGFCAHISKYVLRAKVRIVPQPEGTMRFSSASAVSEAEPLRIEDRRFEVAGVGGTDLHLDLEEDPKGMPSADAGRQWMRMQIEQGIPWIGERTCGLFVAQNVNFDLLGGVSFTKGCYVGQEIIARMHYRGTPKQRMFHAEGAGTPPAEGAALYNDCYGEQVAGHVVNSVADGDGFVALACMRIAAAGDVSRTAPDGGQEMRLAEIKY